MSNTSANGVTLPNTGGRVSTFGGMTDTMVGERFNNLAFTTIDPDETKAHGGTGWAAVSHYLARKWPLWFRSMFVGDDSAAVIGGQNGKWGLQTYLHTSALYCAGQFSAKRDRKQLDNNAPWLTMTNQRTGKKVTLLVIDIGPAVSTGRKWDVSPWGMRYMDGKTNDTVSVRWATTEEIKDAQNYQEELGRVGLENTAKYLSWTSRALSPSTASSAVSTAAEKAGEPVMEASAGATNALLILVAGAGALFLGAAVRRRKRR